MGFFVGVAKGYAPYMGVGGGEGHRGVCSVSGGSLGHRFEGLPRGVRGDALACRGHPYMFLIFAKSAPRFSIPFSLPCDSIFLQRQLQTNT